jgi:predicted LPLAT superfamily acyltransferase
LEIRPIILIPHFNNHSTVESVITGCRRAAKLPILVIDDGSVPALELNDVNMIRLPVNQGKGIALRTAFAAAIEGGYTHALVIDADGQHSPEDIPKFLAAAEQQPFALISGARDFNQGSIPGRSRFGRKNSNFWVWFHTGFHMGDSQSGFRIYPLFGFGAIKCFSRRYAFEVEYAVRWLWKFKVAPVAVPVTVEYSATTVSHFRKYKDNMRASLMHARLAAETAFLPMWMITRVYQACLHRDRRPWTGRLRGGRWGNLLLQVMAQSLPRGLLEWVLMLFVVPYFMFAAPKARGALREFREQLNGVRARYNIWSRWRHDYRHFLAFASTLVDRLYASQGRLPVKVVDLAEAEATVHLFRRQQDGGVIVSAHFGCLDIASEAYMQREGQRKILPMAYYARDGLSVAEVLGKEMRTVDLFDVRKRIVETSELFCFLADRPVQSQIEAVPFLGAIVFIDAVPFRLAIMCKCLDPLLSTEAGAEQLGLLIGEYVRFLEQVVVRYPESWFNFYRYFSQLPWTPQGPLWPKVRGRVKYAVSNSYRMGQTQWTQTDRHQNLLQ